MGGLGLVDPKQRVSHCAVAVGFAPERETLLRNEIRTFYVKKVKKIQNCI